MDLNHLIACFEFEAVLHVCGGLFKGSGPRDLPKYRQLESREPGLMYSLNEFCVDFCMCKDALECRDRIMTRSHPP